MAHHTSTHRDPPDASFCDLDRRKSTELQRASCKPGARTAGEVPPTATPSPQNAKKSRKAIFASDEFSLRSDRRNSKSRLEFHRIAHSFPDYGSVKGAVRMPHPFKFLSTVFAPLTHLDTLDSAPGCPPVPHQQNKARTPGLPSPPKRQKVHHPNSRVGNRDDEIVDAEQDVASRTERRGSQSSFAQSVSPGISEFQTVEASSMRGERSNRRTRRAHANRPSVVTSHINRLPSELEAIESFDELAPAPKPDTCHRRKARLVSTVGAKPNRTKPDKAKPNRAKPHAVINDAADMYIVGGRMRPRQHRQGLSTGKKRSNHETTEDQDELEKEETTRGGAAGAVARQLVEDSPERCPPSLSRRGDMKPTNWDNKPNPDASASGFKVQAALCLPNLRYGVGDGQDPCFLRPTMATELRAFTDDDNEAEPYGWLKITAKAKTLFYHPDSNLILIKQASDQASSMMIGGLMMLKLDSGADALRIARWVGSNLGTRIVEEQQSRLHVVWDKKNQEISQASSLSPARRLLGGTFASQERRINDPPTMNPAIPSTASASCPTAIRHQMQVSGQQYTPSVFGVRSPSEITPPGTRSMRTRQTAQREPEAIIHRWSEEHPDWAKDWKMPLVFKRTTVDKDDIPRLDEGQCLNDNIIGYGLRYLFDKFSMRQHDLHERVYLHNSFFYEKLKAGRGMINYDGVKNWTAKVDLLSYDYIIVPVNEHFHWWVAIICNPGKLDPDMREQPAGAEGQSNGPEEGTNAASLDVKMTDIVAQQPVHSPRAPATGEANDVESDIVNLVSDDKNVSIDLTSGPKVKQTKRSKPAMRAYNFRDPRIITLDSLGSTHPQAIGLLKKYLLAEFQHKRNKIITDPPQQLGMRATNIPEQNNLCDCGVYLLGYIQEFVKNPDLFIQTLLRRESPDWDFSPSELRSLWRDTIQHEHKTYQENQLKAAQRKREASAAKRTPIGSMEPSHRPSRETSEVVDATNNGRRAGVDSAEQSSTAKTGTLVKPDVPEETGHIPTLIPLDLKANDSKHMQSASRAPTPTPQQPPPQQMDLDEEGVVILPPQEHGDDNEPVLPSIEAPDVEELPGPPRPQQPADEPRFLAPLSSSSPSDADDEDDGFAEVGPGSFYSSAARLRSGSSNSSSRGQKSMVLSSPSSAVRHRRRTAKTRPTGQHQQQQRHMSSHFATDGGEGLEPVVETAEVVRLADADPIDLT